MSTTREELKRWLLSGTEDGFSHMAVICDTFSYEDYPFYISTGQDPRQIINDYLDDNKMARLMEVYSYNRDIESQLNQPRAFNYD